MPRAETPGLSSSRIQRAMRLNNIEDGRLTNSYRLMDCEQKRHVTIMNQTVRLVHLSLDAIRTSSGATSEAASPRRSKQEVKPCFEYGERQYSRKFGKFRQSNSSRRASSASGTRRGSITSGTRRGSITSGRSGVNETETQRGASDASPRRPVTSSGMSVGVRQTHEGYAGPPTLKPPKSAPPGFSRSQARRDAMEETCPGIARAIRQVGERAQLKSDMEEMLSRIRKQRSQQRSEDTSGYHERLLQRLPVNQLWSVRHASPERHRDLMDVKRAVQLVNQSRLESRMDEFRTRCPLTNRHSDTRTGLITAEPPGTVATGDS